MSYCASPRAWLSIYSICMDYGTYVYITEIASWSIITVVNGSLSPLSPYREAARCTCISGSLHKCRYEVNALQSTRSNNAFYIMDPLNHKYVQYLDTELRQ